MPLLLSHLKISWIFLQLSQSEHLASLFKTFEWWQLLSDLSPNSTDTQALPDLVSPYPDKLIQYFYPIASRIPKQSELVTASPKVS